MALTTTADYQLAINQFLWIMFRGYGLDFPFYQVTRDGGMSEADAITLRTNFETYYQNRNAAPSMDAQHPDKPTTKITDLHGRSNRGGSGSEETNVSDYEFQTGRSDRGGNASENSEFPVTGGNAGR